MSESRFSPLDLHVLMGERGNHADGAGEQCREGRGDRLVLARGGGTILTAVRAGTVRVGTEGSGREHVKTRESSGGGRWVRNDGDLEAGMSSTCVQSRQEASVAGAWGTF